MQISESTHGEVIVLQPSGRFDTHATDAFLAALTDTRRNRVGEVVVDMHDVEFVDEHALQTLSTARRQLMEERGGLLIAAPSQSVRVIMELTGHADDLDLFPSRQMAVDAVSGLKVAA